MAAEPNTSAPAKAGAQGGYPEAEHGILPSQARRFFAASPGASAISAAFRFRRQEKGRHPGTEAAFLP